MNTKEAIETMRSLNEILCEETISDIVSALKHGEKYEAMFSEFEYKILNMNFGNCYYPFKEKLEKMKNDLKQKYFPKPANKIVVIEFESDNENAIESNINILKAHLERVRNIPPQIKYTVREGD